MRAHGNQDSSSEARLNQNATFCSEALNSKPLFSHTIEPLIILACSIVSIGFLRNSLRFAGIHCIPEGAHRFTFEFFDYLKKLIWFDSDSIGVLKEIIYLHWKTLDSSRNTLDFIDLLKEII